jgi:hypothetical protein
MSRIAAGALIFLVVAGMTAVATAGTVELSPFYGWRFGGDMVDYYYGDRYNLDDASAYGLAIDIELDPYDETWIEVRWSHQQTELNTTNPDVGRLDLGIDYFHIGGLKAFGDHGDNFVPYGVGTLGATHFNPDAGFGSDTRFSFGLGGGVKLMFAKRVGVRLEGRVLGTYFPSSAAVICGGYPGGCSIGISGNMLWQGEVTAGLVIALGKPAGHSVRR